MTRRWNEEAVGLMAADAVESGYLSMPEADTQHPAWCFWEEVTTRYGIPFVVVQEQRKGVATVGVIRFGVARDRRTWRSLRDLIDKAVRSAGGGCRRITEDGLHIAGPLSPTSACALASKLAGITGVMFPLTAREE